MSTKIGRQKKRLVRRLGFVEVTYLQLWTLWAQVHVVLINEKGHLRYFVDPDDFRIARTLRACSQFRP